MTIPKLECPIILVHGFLGYDTVRVGRIILARYWPGIPDALRLAGNRAFIPTVSPLGTIAQRAAQLKTFIDTESPHEPVHIIGHSMGGLDARYMISRLGMEDRVLSLTTIGTPHHGSSFADWFLQRCDPVIGPIFDFFNLTRDAVRDLTTTSCRQFNEEVIDSSKVRYFSVAGRFQASLLSFWRLAARIVQRHEGDNDGIVSITSATYGEDCTFWEGDHLSLVNTHSLWARLRGKAPDRIPHYTALLGRLKDEGF